MQRMVRALPLQSFLRDSRVQPRESINLSKVTEYAMAMAKAPVYQAAGLSVKPFPPVVAFCEHDDQGNDLYWLADGWHRLLAAEEAGLRSFPTEIHEGTVLDAIMHAAGANADHGIARTNRDKHRAVRMLLDHPIIIRESWANVRIAHAAGVSDALVRAVRREREVELGLPPSTERRGSDGKIYSLQLRRERKIAEGAQEPTSDQKIAPEGSSVDSGAFLYQCDTEDCEAITTEPSWHCTSCGSHLPSREYPTGIECPICSDDPLTVPLDILARVESVEIPKTHTNGTTQVPYTPGTMKPSGVTLAYERLVAAIGLVDSLAEFTIHDLLAESPNVERFIAQLAGARTTLHAMVEQYYDTYAGVVR